MFSWKTTAIAQGAPLTVGHLLRGPKGEIAQTINGLLGGTIGALVLLLCLCGPSIAQGYGVRNCKGYAGPGGPCYAGPGGPAYDGPGGPAYRGPGGACYAAPGGPAYGGPGGPCYSGPGGSGQSCPSICWQP